jgi:hypothetical protein
MRIALLTADDYVEMWRGEYEPRGLWISDEFRRADAEVWAAIDRALGPTPTMEDLAALRLWRRTHEAFGDGNAPSCPIRRFVRPTLRVVA